MVYSCAKNHHKNHFLRVIDRVSMTLIGLQRPRDVQYFISEQIVFVLNYQITDLDYSLSCTIYFEFSPLYPGQRVGDETFQCNS